MRLRMGLFAVPMFASCVGPTLEVGEHVLAVEDAGAEFDASAGDARARDGNFGDRDPHLEERRPCRNDGDCYFYNAFRRACSPTRFVCVECNDDRQCASDQCVEPEGYCRDVERPRDQPAPPP